MKQQKERKLINCVVEEGRHIEQIAVCLTNGTIVINTRSIYECV